MNTGSTWLVISLAVIIINCASMYLTFPARYRLRDTAGALILFTTAFFAAMYLTDTAGEAYGGLRALLFFPLLAWLFKGSLYQKLFGLLLPLLLTMLQFALVEAALKLYMIYGSEAYYTALTAVTLTVFAGYAVLLFKFGRRVFKRLFEPGRPLEWTAYALGLLFSCVILALYRFAAISPVLYILLLLFILWSFGVLCYAIIRTHERTKHIYELALARDMIASGSVYYQKKNGMDSTLRIMRRDCVYHLNTVRSLLRAGDYGRIEEYIDKALPQLTDKELSRLCENRVINALLAGYAERCDRLLIAFAVDISLPDSLSIPDYEMCIILGNLLENAVDASLSSAPGRRIELSAKTEDEQLVIRVWNHFNGEIIYDGDWPISRKSNGGLGLRSVRAVVERHGGKLKTEWDDNTFTAYVYV